MADTKDLNVLLDAQVPIIGIESPDEERVLQFLLRFAMQRNLSFYEWTITQGLRLGGFGTDVGTDDSAGSHEEPEALLKHIAKTGGPWTLRALRLPPLLRGRTQEHSLSKRYRPKPPAAR